MARKALVQRELKRAKLAEKYAARRAEMKAVGDFEGLAKLPRNSNPNRQRNRCEVTGRPRGVFRKFGLCRNKLRDVVMRGEVPGVTKASW